MEYSCDESGEWRLGKVWRVEVGRGVESGGWERCDESGAQL